LGVISIAAGAGKKGRKMYFLFSHICANIKKKGGWRMARTSSKAQEILTFVESFIQENGYAPSVREIGASVGLNSTASVSYHLQQLQEKGLL
jgi:hypothetical protein